MHKFTLHADYEPAGDQPEAISRLLEGLADGLADQALLGVTGSGKSVGYEDQVLIIEHQAKSMIPRVVQIGPFIDKLLVKHGTELISKSDTLQLKTRGISFSTVSFDKSYATTL